VTYEGFGPGGVALLIDTVTDNPTRTVADVRSKMSRHGGNLGAQNSVAWMFEKKGQLYVDASKYDEDTLMEAALDAGAEDVQREDTQFVVSTGATEFHAVQTALKSKSIDITEAELAMVPKNTVKVAGKDTESLFKLLETLEDLDDVQKVWANFDVDAGEMSRVGG
jgi:YebC/PmpR family DNA-binding regulatory protein